MNAGLLEPVSFHGSGERRSPERASRLPPPLSFIEPLPVSLRTYETLTALADRIALLLQGRGFDLAIGSAALPGLDTFPKVTVYAAGRTRAEAEWIGAAVLLTPGGVRADLDVLHDALEAAQRRRG